MKVSPSFRVALPPIISPSRISGPLRIEHYRGWNTETVSYATEGLYVFCVVVMASVRKIEARDVHARKKHFAENVFAV